MEEVELTLQQVQGALLARFSDKTILIGHSLESDLHALKVRLFLPRIFHCIGINNSSLHIHHIVISLNSSPYHKTASLVHMCGWQ